MRMSVAQQHDDAEEDECAMVKKMCVRCCVFDSGLSHSSVPVFIMQARNKVNHYSSSVSGH